MQQQLSWQYDEFAQVSRDYSSNVEVDIYDRSHADFRDIEAENDRDFRSSASRLKVA
jgi:putative AdoMet-dependent methyltransferase